MNFFLSKFIKIKTFNIKTFFLPILSAKLGIPSILEGEVNISAGYDGIITLGERLKKVLRARRILSTLKDYNEFPYTRQWLEDERLYV